MKRFDSVNGCRWPGVAPFAGAWIETYLLHIILVLSLVAPFAGAWIETILGRDNDIA